MTTEPSVELENADEREEAQQISRHEAIRDAQQLLRVARFGVLSTLSKKYEGWPFGSIVPYALDRSGHPILLIASIAEHTRNVKADGRASLLVHADASAHDDDVQAHGRLTLMGRVVPVSEADRRDAEARYVVRVPDALSYFATHDFAFYRLEIEHIRYIGGFGRIFWLERASFEEVPAEDPLASDAQGIVDHMNEDHTDALVLYCRAFRAVEPAEVRMVAVDRWGFDVECQGPDRRLRFDFDEPVTMDTIRAKVVAMVKEARQQLAASNGST